MTFLVSVKKVRMSTAQVVMTKGFYFLLCLPSHQTI